MREPKPILSPASPEPLAGEGVRRPNAIVVGTADILALIDDRVGVCLNCLTLADPVPNDAMGRTCEACGQACVAGIFHALRNGAIRVDSAFDA